MNIRYLIAAAVVWYALFGVPNVPGVIPSAPYTGSLTALHGAAGSMDAAGRRSLSDTLDAAATMIESDRAGAIKTTEQLQAAIRATIAFSHTAFATERYPAVASALQAELEKAVGSEVGPLDSAKRAGTVATLREAAKAVR